MPSFRQRLLDLLAIGRVANLPTVWSNVLLGVFLGFAVPAASLASVPSDLRIGLPGILLTLLAASCAYLCGTFLNDWKDADFDRQHRPERAIPAGRFRPRSILTAALALGAASLLAFAILSPAVLAIGFLLLVFILGYTAIHKRTPLAVIPMGLCRSCLYLIGFLAVTTHLDWGALPASVRSPSDLLGDPTLAGTVLQLLTLALGIFLYIAGLTLAARYESCPGGVRAPRVLIWAPLFAPLLTHTWWWIFHRPPFLEGWHLAIPALLGLLPFLAWTSRALVVLKQSIGAFVARSLAGLCLVDLLAIPGLATLVTTPWPKLDSYPLLLALFPLSFFLFALLLQRFAPAT